MIYNAIITKKKKFFQKPYIIDGINAYITDTKRSKKKFMNDIHSAVFEEKYAHDKVFGPYLEEMRGYDSEFLAGYVEAFAEHLIKYLKIKTPVDEILITDENFAQSVCRWAKTITVTAQGEDKFLNGVYIRYMPHVKTKPDIAILQADTNTALLREVPTVDLRKNAESGKNISAWKTMSFKTSLFPFEIGAESLIYLRNKGIDFTYELTSLRKKCPLLFTFL